jgi:YD repeat-containing protein
MKPLFSNFAVAGRSRLRNLIPVSITKIARFQLALALLLISALRLPAPIFELPEKPPQAPGVSVNADGSRTHYEVDNAHRRATSTITERDGKLRQKIQYELDAAGRFISRAVFDADGKLRSKTEYKYDKAGRVLEQTQLAKDEAILNKIAYSYDRQTGKQTSYSVFDGNGKLVNQTAESASRPAPPPKPSASPRRRGREFEGTAPGG